MSRHNPPFPDSLETKVHIHRPAPQDGCGRIRCAQFRMDIEDVSQDLSSRVCSRHLATAPPIPADLTTESGKEFTRFFRITAGQIIELDRFVPIIQAGIWIHGIFLRAELMFALYRMNCPIERPASRTWQRHGKGQA